MSQRDRQLRQWTRQFSPKGFGWMVAAGAIALAGCTSLQTSPTTTESSVVQSPSPTPTGLLPNPSPTEISPSVSPTTSLSPSPTVEKPESVKTVETNLAGLVGKAGNLTIQSVDCPATLVAPTPTGTPAAATTPKTYECQVTSDAGGFTVVVEPTSDPNKFRWGTKGMLLLSKLNDFIQKSAESKDLGKVGVDCGGKIRPAKAGETFDCKVTDAKGSLRTVKVTVRDEAGNVFIAPL
ncbi:DUF4333 domain-containing protein [Phormidium sp. CLA17]|uniref:DUF4333 domain-containing protein n=1 Tax=Leptolyngbya sp. Cla-17 TaxID=2803751 RepID=UPI00149247E8|nr:DUF4333 domain-containing protein [Leptolyngbya sp. Cla-17]MBM0742469.1 DUF4333 domain-containing protein [Leptolyngbya sp. Cla-17]